MIKHTPAPWEFRNNDGDWKIYADGYPIMGDTEYYPWVPKNEADWQLISAAPDLLRELISAREIIAQLQSTMSGEFFAAQIASFDAAIAKATGE